MLYHLAYIALVATLAFSLPSYYLDPDSVKFIFILGAVAIWRYSWAATHFIRALIYTRLKFPKMRRRSDQAGELADPEHVFLLLTTFRINSETSAVVYREAFKEAIACGKPVTVVGSIVEMSEERLIKQLFLLLDPPAHVQLKLVRIKGTGKRDGLAAGFNAVSNSLVELENSVVAVIDGDSILAPGTLEKCYRFFHLYPRLGALTTDEICSLDGEGRFTGLYRRWYNLRFAMRTVHMSSMGLSRRVLTLTGRMSMFRGNIVADPEFIDRVKFDYIDDWRLGRFRFLTGDDKSSWYHVLKEGWEMFYIPDVVVKTIETPPHDNFFVGARVLMRRWFGNMLRTNVRARKVPLGESGFFTWWNLIDQRVSMWTSLFGFVGAILASIVAGPWIIMAFITWILFTRYTMTLLLSMFHRDFSIAWPFLIYFNQIYGSWVKIYVVNHLYKQSWTRQKTKLQIRGGRLRQWYMEASSTLSWATQWVLFLTFMSFLAGLLTYKDVIEFRQFIGF